LYHIRKSNSISKAPGEAEAELARLNELGIIDTILTSDADALLFGATTVITLYV
jgi:Holliday junction resolvase YEN1